MSAITFSRSVEKLLQPCRLLSLRDVNRPPLLRHRFQRHRHSSVTGVSRAPLARGWVISELPASKESKYQVHPELFGTSRHSTIQRRSVFSTTMGDTGQLEQIRALLPLTLLEELSTLWFQHIVNEQDLAVPSPDTMMHWFRKDEAFDQLCS